MFYNNSKEYFKKYNDLEPSYFENESEFKNQLNEDFIQAVNLIIPDFVD